MAYRLGADHYAPDTLGSTALLLNPSGAVMDTFTYQPYGEIASHVRVPIEIDHSFQRKSNACSNRNRTVIPIEIERFAPFSRTKKLSRI